MWTKLFKFVKLVPGKVVVPSHGTIDFSNPNLPIDLVQRLYEEDFPYLQITPEGEKQLYGRDITPQQVPPTEVIIIAEEKPAEDINPQNDHDAMGAPLNPETHQHQPKRKTKNPRRKP